MLVRDPVYLQINEELRALIGRGERKAGDRFLSEREISERYRVSRVTANKALSNLVSEGILEFRQGIGTFVRPGALHYNLRSLVSFTGMALAAGKRPSTRVLRFERIPRLGLPPEVGRLLGAGDADEKFLYMERLRLADGAPVILERRYVVSARCPGLGLRDCAGSLYALWISRYRLKIEGAEQTIQAVNLGRRDARHLAVRAGSAALQVVSLGSLRGGEPLWWERTTYRADAYCFRNRLGPIAAAGPAVGAFL